MPALRTPTDSLQSQKPSPPPHLLSSIFYLLPLAWLWFRLIDHLRVEWSVNPQYAYGWAVPFLCAYLLWRKAKCRKQKAEIGHQKTVVSGPVVSGQWSVVSGPAVLWSLAFCALLYLPTRLIQEANPEWRLVSWALAIEVVAITLLLLRTIHYGPLTTTPPSSVAEPVLGSPAEGGLRSVARPRATDHVSRITYHVSRFTFPICFFLVAVPWP